MEIQFPFQIGSGGSVSTVTRDEDVARQRVIVGVLTMRNERVMRPELGSGAMQSVFSNIDETMLTELEIEINRAVKNVDSHITIGSVSSSFDPGTGRLLITIPFSAGLHNTVQTIVFDDSGALRDELAS